MNAREILHAVLKIAHIAEEIFGKFLDWFDCWSWRYWRTRCGICERVRGYGCRRSRVTSDEGGYEHGEQKNR